MEVDIANILRPRLPNGKWIWLKELFGGDLYRDMPQDIIGNWTILRSAKPIKTLQDAINAMHKKKKED